MCDSSIKKVIYKLNSDIPIVLNWFRHNEVVVNPDKFQVMFLGCENNRSIVIENLIIHSSDCGKLLGVTLDNKLNFTTYINDICNKANHKINALLRIRKYLDIKKATLLYNSHILSCFQYCPLIWMFCSKTATRLINRTHCRALRALHMDFTTSLARKI